MNTVIFLDWLAVLGSTDLLGPKVIKHFSFSAQLSMKFILLTTVVAILTFISRINTTSECFSQGKNHYFSVFYFLLAVEISGSVELSMNKVL